TFSEVLAKSGLEDDKRYVVGTRIFGKALRGMAIIFLRDKFGKDDRQPEADDPLVNVSFDTEFQGQFRMNGKKIVVQPRAGDQVQIKLADESASPEEGTYIIGENQKIFPGDAKKQLALIKSLVQFTEQEMNKEKSEDEIIISMIEGAHENRPGRSLGGGVIRYNQKTGWGFSLGYNMDEQSGLLSIGYGMIDSDFERLAIEEGQKVWMAGSQRLAGVGLGEIVYIKDKDEERQTATLRYQHPTRGWMEMRVNYNPNGEQPVMYREGSETKVYYQPMFLIKAGSIINIGGQPLGTTDIGGVQHDAFEITVLASDMMFNSVVGLCEIPGFALPFGAYDLDVFGATNSGSVVESIPSAIKRADESKQVAQLRRKLEKETGELLSDLRGLEVPEPMSTTNARRRALMERLEQIRKQADEKGWIERLDNPSMSVIQWRFKKLSDEDLALEDKFLALKSCIF
ncbi:MAG: hypothetical protein KDD43_13620, partial [Bdellovibrionales bacterium]|nr:hypothetical protein [Bdellovibrionales bacterium]